MKKHIEHKNSGTCSRMVIVDVEDGVVTENVSAIEEFILISTEVRGYRNEDHRPTEEAKATAKAGDTFLVDHVRVFDIVE